jgi:hypothetical protein
MESSVGFPGISRPASAALSTVSTVSTRQSTALQVCDLVFGESGADATDWDAVESLYEANASELIRL